MQKSFTLLFVVIVFHLFSCDNERPVFFKVGKPVMVDVEAPTKKINPKLRFQFSSLDLFQDLHTLNMKQFKMYGSFYTRDFVIYQVKDLDLLEDNQYISEVYLYFVDNSLHKIQAFTTKNMADFFLTKYGGAKMVLKDRFNKDLAMLEGAVSKKSGRTMINKNLSNYKLKWNSDDRLISYQVDESSQKNFEAIEELVDIENQEKIKVKPSYVFTIQSNTYNQLLARVKYDEASSF